MNQKKIVLTGMLIALTAVVTYLIRIPTPLTQGYINLGDIVIIFSAFHLGSRNGAIIGGVGSALADILAGYPYYPVTLLVKGLMGAVAGLPVFAIREGAEPSENQTRILMAGISAALVMVAGYFAMQVLVFGLVKAMTSLVPNIIQGAAGIFGAHLMVKKGFGKHVQEWR